MQSRRVNPQNWQGFWVFLGSNGFTDEDVVDPTDGDNVACLGFLDFVSLQTEVTKKLGHAEVLLGAVKLHDSNFVADLDLAPVNAADADPANVVVPVKHGDLELQRFVFVVKRSRNGLDYRVEDRVHGFFLVSRVV